MFLAAQNGSPSPAQRRLLATVSAANAAGFMIRVAAIPQPYDLGSVTALWRRPQLYARFLSFELASAYPGRLLVAMPNGIGLSRRGRSLNTAGAGQPADALQPAGAGPDALASRARAVVIALARAAGVSLRTRPGAGASAGPTAGGNARTSQSSPVASGAGPLPWIAAACALVALASLSVTLARPRSRWTVPGIVVMGVVAFAVPILLVESLRHQDSPASAAAPTAAERVAANAAAPRPFSGRRARARHRTSR